VLRWLIICRLNGIVILDISHGYEVKDEDDQFVRLAETTVAELMRAAVPGAFLVDFIPSRRIVPLVNPIVPKLDVLVNYLPEWIPGTGFKKIAAAMIKSRERLLSEPYNFTVQELVRRIFAPCYICDELDRLLDGQKNLSLQRISRGKKFHARKRSSYKWVQQHFTWPEVTQCTFYLIYMLF
jgi:hypothetical protein